MKGNVRSIISIISILAVALHACAPEKIKCADEGVLLQNANIVRSFYGPISITLQNTDWQNNQLQEGPQTITGTITTRTYSLDETPNEEEVIPEGEWLDLMGNPIKYISTERTLPANSTQPDEAETDLNDTGAFCLAKTGDNLGVYSKK